MTPARSTPRARPSAPVAPSRGYLLLGVLVALALVAAAAVDVGQRLADQRVREAELELLDAGEAYRRAIEAYWRATPGPRKALPTRVDELLLDPRFPQPVRHLRRAWPDPLSPQGEWELIRQGAGIVGVRSRSTREPFRRTGFSEAQAGFEQATSHADWRFVARLPVPAAASAPAGGAAGATR